MATRKHSKLKTFLESSFIEFSQAQDSDRLKALYSDFSKLSLLNKYAYDTNVSYWQRVILECNQQGYLGSNEYSLVIEKEVVGDKFQRPVIGKPLALGCVLDTMERKEELIELKEFNKRYAPHSTWFNWILNTFQWKWRNEHVTLTKQYVVLPTIKSISKAIMTHHFQAENSCKSILTLTEFKSIYANQFINELTNEDIILILRYIHSKHGIALSDNVKGYGTTYTVIKFPSRENEIAIITQHDEAIISIRTTCHALSIQVDELQCKSEELQKQSILEKSQGHTSMALYCLKRRNNLLKILDTRLKSMETMDSILLKIETSHDDLQVIQAFNMGADALRGLLGQDGLTLESVDEAMEKIQNALQDQKEVENAIKTGNEEMSGYTDQDMEDELSELIQQESSPPPPVNINTGVNSELSRLNQMFSSVKNVPSFNNPSSSSSSLKRKQELA